MMNAIWRWAVFYFYRATFAFAAVMAIALCLDYANEPRPVAIAGLALLALVAFRAFWRSAP